MSIQFKNGMNIQDIENELKTGLQLDNKKKIKGKLLYKESLLKYYDKNYFNINENCLISLEILKKFLYGEMMLSFMFNKDRFQDNTHHYLKNNNINTIFDDAKIQNIHIFLHYNDFDYDYVFYDFLFNSTIKFSDIFIYKNTDDYLVLSLFNNDYEIIFNDDIVSNLIDVEIICNCF